MAHSEGKPTHTMEDLEGQSFYTHWRQVNEVASAPDSDPRIVAIMGVAYIDDALTEILQLKMPGLNSDLRSKLFGGHGALAGLAAKIDLAMALGTVSSRDTKMLITLKRVRDRFAHSIAITDFEHPDVAKLIDTISTTYKESGGPVVRTVVGPHDGLSRGELYRNTLSRVALTLYGYRLDQFARSFSGAA